MRVTLSHLTRAFGPGGREAKAGGPLRPDDAGAHPGEEFGQGAADGGADQALAAFMAPQDADAIPDLPPHLQAWLSPHAGGGGETCGPFCATMPPRPGQMEQAPPPAFDRDALMQAATGRLSAAPVDAPERPLRVMIEVAGADICGRGGGVVQLRFAPRHANCDPVYLAIDEEAALALARRLLAQGELRPAPARAAS